MLGMFVSTLPIRMTADPDAEFLSFVRGSRKRATVCYAAPEISLQSFLSMN
ncbi:hypothetical protein QNN00_16020 [Bacillus velezensis]|nr:hypothetical protein [Bacillus velezensis]